MSTDQNEYVAAHKELDSQERNDLEASQFGLPDKRSYPMPDKNHARVALSRASEEFNKGNLTQDEKARIDAKAHKILGAE